LLGIVFYHGRLMFDSPDAEWGLPQIVMLVVVLAGYGVYDRLALSSLSKKGTAFAAAGFVLLTGVYLGLALWAEFSYRAGIIHAGFLLGTIMTGNVWMHIWPSQKKFIRALREGTAPDPAWMEKSLLRSRHNVYASFPLLWTMINVHTIVFAQFWFVFPLVVLCAWLVLGLLYKKSAAVRVDV